VVNELRVMVVRAKSNNCAKLVGKLPLIERGEKLQVK